MINSGPAKVLIVIAVAVGVAYVLPVGAQIFKKEPDANQLSSGQKVLGSSCLNATSTVDIVRTPRGTQYNCIKRKREQG